MKKNAKRGNVKKTIKKSRRNAMRKFFKTIIIVCLLMIFLSSAALIIINLYSEEQNINEGSLSELSLTAILGSLKEKTIFPFLVVLIVILTSVILICYIILYSLREKIKVN